MHIWARFIKSESHMKYWVVNSIVEIDVEVKVRI